VSCLTCDLDVDATTPTILGLCTAMCLVLLKLDGRMRGTVSAQLGGRTGTMSSRGLMDLQKPMGPQSSNSKSSKFYVLYLNTVSYGSDFYVRLLWDG